LLTIATPNHGTNLIPGYDNLLIILLGTALLIGFLAFLLDKSGLLEVALIVLLFDIILFFIGAGGINAFAKQARQMHPADSFIQNLNEGDETPYSTTDNTPYNHITWSTFRGQGQGGDLVLILAQIAFFFAFKFGSNDGLVNEDSVPLNASDCTNYGPYERNHNKMIEFDGAFYDDRQYFKDIYFVLTNESIPSHITENLPQDQIVLTLKVPVQTEANVSFEIDLLVYNGIYRTQSQSIYVNIDFLRGDAISTTIFIKEMMVNYYLSSYYVHYKVLASELYPGQWVEKAITVILQQYSGYLYSIRWLWITLYRSDNTEIIHYFYSIYVGPYIPFPPEI